MDTLELVNVIKYQSSEYYFPLERRIDDMKAVFEYKYLMYKIPNYYIVYLNRIQFSFPVPKVTNNYNDNTYLYA